MQGTTKALSILEFCRMANISRATFYNLDAAGQSPKTVRIGARRVVLQDTATAWLRAREN